MGSWRTVRLCLPQTDGPAVRLEGSQCGPLAIHKALGDSDRPLSTGKGWGVSHVATGLGLGGPALETAEEAQAVVRAILADAALWRTFSATTRKAVEAGAPPDVQLRLQAAWTSLLTRSIDIT